MQRDASMMRCILAAVDATDHAPYVVREASELAKRFGGALVLFRVIEQLTDEVAARARDELEQLGGFARTLGVTTTVRVVTSTDTSSAVVAAADDARADAIVIGDDGYQLVAQVLRGRVPQPTVVVVR